MKILSRTASIVLHYVCSMKILARTASIVLHYVCSMKILARTVSIVLAHYVCRMKIPARTASTALAHFILHATLLAWPCKLFSLIVGTRDMMVSLSFRVAVLALLVLAIVGIFRRKAGFLLPYFCCHAGAWLAAFAGFLVAAINYLVFGEPVYPLVQLGMLPSLRGRCLIFAFACFAGLLVTEAYYLRVLWACYGLLLTIDGGEDAAPVAAYHAVAADPNYDKDMEAGSGIVAAAAAV